MCQGTREVVLFAGFISIPFTIEKGEIADFRAWNLGSVQPSRVFTCNRLWKDRHFPKPRHRGIAMLVYDLSTSWLDTPILWWAVPAKQRG